MVEPPPRPITRRARRPYSQRDWTVTQCCRKDTGEIHYRLFGLFVDMILSGYESFGMTPTELQQRPVLVSDYPYLADCVAGLRTTCPSPADLASQTITASNVYDTCSAGDPQRLAARNECVTLPYPFSESSGVFYLVLKGTSAVKGAVLGALRPESGERRFTTISTLRNELANEAFRASRPTFRGSACAGATPSLERKSYCIEKMDRGG